MARLNLAGQSGSLDHIDTTQDEFRGQIAVLNDALRQLGGRPEIGSGALVNDPLSAPYVLYVNPYTGSDRFVGGSYSTSGTALQRIELQRLECGYTEARPFRTINRAIIEAGIITAKSYYESPIANNDLVTIVVMPGAATVLNGAGAGSVSEWASGTDPTNEQLQAFNPATVGGILLPRGVSLCGMDLRKTIIRPEFVPSSADEAADASNRRAIFKATGTGYYFGFTFMDKVGSTSSHHLLSCFEFASQAELDAFYTKIRSAFGGTNNTGGLDNALAVTRASEYELVGPRPNSGSQTITTDTTTSASPYIFNCSIRSNYGLCGVYADGAKPTGFRSMVIAQFTGVSLQRDLSCWQKYESAQTPNWGPYFSNYGDYINADPDNVRMHPSRRSFHIRAVNNAIIQEVSVFAIGQGIHHWVQTGGELTITNSNSNFGGCAGLAEGYRSAAFQADSNWNVGSIRVATNLADKRNNVRKIFLGNVANSVTNTATTITLTLPLDDSFNKPGIPSILERDGYSLPTGSYIWIENTRGRDYRAQLTASAWSPLTPAVITVQAAFVNEDGISPGDALINSQGFNTGQTWPDLAGARIYVRRLQDSRSTDERRYSLRCNNTNILSRTPLRDYVLQTAVGSDSIASAIPESALVVVASSANVAPGTAGVNRSASVELRRNNPTVTWGANTLYRPGDVVRYLNKHFSCTTENADAAFDLTKWEEIYVHMEESYNAEDYWKNAQPAIIFDNDTDPVDATISCGYNLATVWSTNAAIQAQYRSATDYRGLHSFLVSLGFSSSNAHTLLLPREKDSRERSPSSALDGLAAPSGAATGWANWPIEFRRPSNIRLFGHAWEWSGFLNYTKALPEYQLELGPLNKFTYFFTNKNGGRVYGSGFNEEGFLVTPQGLQDLATGTEIAPESLGEPNVPIDEIVFPTFYDELTANKVTVNTELNLSGTVVRGSPVWEVPPIPGVRDIHIASDASIQGTKILPDFGSQDTVTSGRSFHGSFIPTSATVPVSGLYRPSANTCALSAAGTGRVFVDADGNVRVNGFILENAGTNTYVNVVTQTDIGSDPNQISLNQMLGTMAFADYPFQRGIASTASVSGNLLINVAEYERYALVSSITGALTLQLSNLTRGREIRIYLRNTNASSRAVTITASTGTSGFSNVNMAPGNSPGAASVTSVTLAATSGTAMLWVANVDNTIIGGFC